MARPATIAILITLGLAALIAACSDAPRGEAVAPSGTVRSDGRSPDRTAVSSPEPAVPSDAGAASAAEDGDATEDSTAAPGAAAAPPDETDLTAAAGDGAPPSAPAPDAGAYGGPGDSIRRPSSGTGILRGVVRFEGEPPRTRPLHVTSDTSVGCGHVDTTDRSLLLDDEGGIQNVVLSIAVAGRKPEASDVPVVLDQKGCRYEPHVTVLPAGSIVRYGNSDSTSHNVHTYPRKNNGMNKVIPAGAHEDQYYEHPDTIEVKCDIHPWMNAFIVLVDTPFAAVSGSGGRFEIRDLPSGPLQLSLWHEKLGKKKERVDVRAGEVTEVTITLGAGDGGGSRKRR